jgi:hypothetical protein
MNPIRGSGATPSMGLSQFRGGRSLSKRMAKMEAESPSVHNLMMDADAAMPSGEYDGAGKHKSEAMAQGHQLGSHLKQLHGGAYVKEFMDGMGYSSSGAYEGDGKHMEGGFHGALAKIAIPLIGSLFGKGEMNKSAHTALMKHFSKKPRSKKPELEGGFFGALASMAIPLISSLFGKGAMTKKAHDDMMAMVKKHDGKGMNGGMSRMVGSGRMVGCGDLVIKHEDDGYSDDDCEHGPMAPKGKAKGGKRVVSASDGRRKRAEIVRRVMKEKGMKMIEASKYVKEKGLY